MPLIIDTYNVLHTTGILPPELAVGEPAELAALIAESRFCSEAVWLVCDGVPRGAARSGRIVIEGAGVGRSADEHIAQCLTRSSAASRMTVVTSDRAVARHAKSRGALTLKSEEFLAMLANDHRKSKKPRARASDPRRAVPLSHVEVDGWMRLFEITAEYAAIQSAKPSKAPANLAPTPKRPSSDRADTALEQFLVATKDLADPLSILEGANGATLLEKLGQLDDRTLDALMAKHEPAVEKDGARIGTRRRAPKPKRR